MEKPKARKKQARKTTYYKKASIARDLVSSNLSTDEIAQKHGLATQTVYQLKSDDEVKALIKKETRKLISLLPQANDISREILLKGLIEAQKINNTTNIYNNPSNNNPSINNTSNNNTSINNPNNNNTISKNNNNPVTLYNKPDYNLIKLALTEADKIQKSVGIVSTPTQSIAITQIYQDNRTQVLAPSVEALLRSQMLDNPLQLHNPAIDITPNDEC